MANPFDLKTLTRITFRGLAGGLIGWLWLWASCGQAMESYPLMLDPTLTSSGLVGHLSIFKDASGKMSFDGIRAAAAAGQFQPVTGDAVTPGYLAQKPLWIRFKVKYQAADRSIWWLFLAPELLETITLYAEQPDGQFFVHEGGRNLPFAQREMAGLGHAFKLGIDPGGVREYFVRVTLNAAIKVELHLWQEKSLYAFLSQVNATFGGYVGLVALLTLMALIRAMTYRNRWDFAYLSYLVGFELFHLTNAGLVQAWGLSDDASLRRGLTQIGLMVSSWSFVALTRTLIVWPSAYSLWPGRLLAVGLVTTLVGLGLVKLFVPEAFFEVHFDVAVSLLLFSTLAGSWAAWRNYPNARALTICFLPFVLWAVFVTVIRWTDIVYVDAWTRNRVLMFTGLAHLFALWLLILGKEARLAQAKQQLETRLASLGEEMANMGLFLDMLTHELNRPLQALATLSLPSEGKRAPDEIATLRHRLVDIRTEFTGIMEICVGRIQQVASNTLAPTDVDLRELVNRIVGHFRQSSRRHLVSAELGNLPTQFCCDAKLIGILLSNLLENAARHAAEGGAIWVTGFEINEESVEIAVMDEGPGISPEDQTRIFDRYTQLPSSSGQKSGMGLGLFIVRRIAEMHGGSVICESEPGEGATFRVILKRGDLKN